MQPVPPVMVRISRVVDPFGGGIRVAEVFVEPEQVLDGEYDPHAGGPEVLENDLPDDAGIAVEGRCPRITEDFVVKALRDGGVFLPPAPDRAGIV